MTTSTSQEFTWWEKSVEYQFITDAVTENVFTLLAPLDGDVERVGDTVFAKGANYIIVEFKKELSSFQSEYRKYRTFSDTTEANNFLTAKAELEKQGETLHHLLITGSISNPKQPKLTVKIFRYFSCATDKPIEVDSIQKAAESGVSKEIFDAYVLTLSKYKGGKGDSESGEDGASGGGQTTNPVVIGISSTRGTTIMPLEDYSQALNLVLSPKASSNYQATHKM
jgi:hypothetical protein